MIATLRSLRLVRSCDRTCRFSVCAILTVMTPRPCGGITWRSIRAAPTERYAPSLLSGARSFSTLSFRNHSAPPLRDGAGYRNYEGRDGRNDRYGERGRGGHWPPRSVAITSALYKLSPKSLRNCPTRAWGQSPTDFSRPKKKRSTFGSSTNSNPPIRLRFSYSHAMRSAAYLI